MRTKRVFKVKQKAFFIIFKGLSRANTCLRPDSAPLTKMLDHLNSTIFVIVQVKLHCHIFQQQQIQAVKKNGSSENSVLLQKESQTELLW